MTLVGNFFDVVVGAEGCGVVEEEDVGVVFRDGVVAEVVDVTHVKDSNLAVMLSQEREK